MCAAMSLLMLQAFSQPEVTTYHNDIGRTGLNPYESILNPLNVGSPNFGLLFNLPVDGQVYAQPLYMPNVNVVNCLKVTAGCEPE